MPSQKPQLSQEKIQERARQIYEAKLQPQVKEAKERIKELGLDQEKIRGELEKITPFTPPKAHQDLVNQFTSALLELDDREQLAELIKIAFEKSPVIAIKVAKALNNPVVLDTLHDLLATDQLYYKLLKEKKL